MANSYISVTYNGSNNVITLPFSYLDKTHLHLYKNATERPYSEMSFNSTGTIVTVTTSLTVGDIITILRQTPISTPWVNYSTDLGALSTTSLNNSNKHNLYAVQEARDYADSTKDEMDTALANAYIVLVDYAEDCAAALSGSQAAQAAAEAAQVAAEAAAASIVFPTSAQILTGLLTVDGSGSGLDADLLDGHEATYFATDAALTSHTGATSVHSATSANTASRIVTRDASGNFSAGTITATLSGNASSATSATSATTAGTATSLANSRTFTITGDVTAPAQSFNGTANVSMPTTLAAATILTKLLTVDGAGTGLDADVLDGMQPASTNTANTVVSRDASKGFSMGTLDASKTKVAEIVSKYTGDSRYPFVESRRGPRIAVAASDVDEWQGNSLWYSGEDPGFTINTSGGITNANKAFWTGDTYATITNASAVVIELLGSIPSDTDIASIRPFLQAHGSITATLKCEVKTAGGTWVTLVEEAVALGSREYWFAPTLSSSGIVYPTDYPLTGIRWTISGMTQSTSSIRQLGLFRGSGRSVKSWVDRGGDTIYGNLNFVAGTCQVRGNNVWHAGNMGTGSGLNADLLQGAAPSETATASSIVKRNSSGVIVGNLTGTATSATHALQMLNSRTFNVSGDLTGTAQGFDGTANVSIPVSLAASTVLSKLLTVDGSGSGLDADVLDGMQPTSLNTASTVVMRDASGDFSAHIITANLTGTATSATYALEMLNSRTFNLSGAVTGTAQSYDGTANVVIPTTITSPVNANITRTTNVTLTANAATCTLQTDGVLALTGSSCQLKGDNSANNKGAGALRVSSATSGTTGGAAAMSSPTRDTSTLNLNCSWSEFTDGNYLCFYMGDTEVARIKQGKVVS